MKLSILAATLLFASPALAQDTPQDAPQETNAPPADAAQDRFFTATDGFKAEETPGGYLPAQSPFSSAPAPGEQITFRPQTLTPDQAFPPPAPLADYPPCAPRQYDNCTQRRR